MTIVSIITDQDLLFNTSLFHSAAYTSGKVCINSTHLAVFARCYTAYIKVWGN